jgi:hypothetical protein
MGFPARGRDIWGMSDTGESRDYRITRIAEVETAAFKIAYVLTPRAHD